MTDPIAEALDAFVPAFVAVDGDWQGVLQAAGYPAAGRPARFSSSPAHSGRQPHRVRLRLRATNRTRILGIAVAAAVICAAAGASTYMLTAHHAAQGPTHPSSSTPIGGPGPRITFVDSAAAADALLPFKVVLPQNAPPPAQLTPPEYVGVYAPRSELDGYYDTPSDGAYDLIEQPTSETVADLQEQAKTWDAGTASIQVIDGVHVLVQSQDFPPTFHDTVGQHITVSWIRGDGASPVLTTLDGPWLSGQPFTVQQALSVATDMIGQGG